MARWPTSRIRLRVAPGARQSAIVGRYGEAWKVRVAAAPEKGKANEMLIRLLADGLELRPDALRLVTGHAGRDKLVEVRGVGQAELERRLVELSREQE